ncbi:MAG: hypothetical protein KGZ50_02985 [Peptococcaceae bacterium]|nr:hypothetical protein [Peptococcaceae bacterium]
MKIIPVLIREKIVKTRKDHRCFGCCEKIPAGSEVHAEICAGDGGIYTLYFCEVCWMFMNENRDLCEDCDGFVYEGWIGDARR